MTGTLPQKNNLDSLRLLGAGAVLFSHSWPIGMGKPYPTIFDIPIGRIGVYLFFFISGLLITQSATRSKSAKVFFINRALRIYPGLIACVLLTAIILGPLASNLNVIEYFSNKETWLYLQNMSGVKLEANLPGVFNNNHLKTVNGSLWTLPYEIACYFIFYLIAKQKSKTASLILLASIFTCATVQLLSDSGTNLPFANQHTERLSRLLIPFSIGSLLATHSKLNERNSIIIVSLASLMLLAWSKNSIHEIATIIATCSLTTLIAFHTPKFNLTPIKWGDFSYGLYIYAFPVQQVLSQALHPQSSREIAAYIITSIAITTIIARISWIFIEKPALKLKPASK